MIRPVGARGLLATSDVAFRQYGIADLLLNNGTLNPLLFFRTTDTTPAPEIFSCLYVENHLNLTTMLFWPNLQAYGFPFNVRPGRFRVFWIPETTVIALQMQAPAGADAGFVNVYGAGFYATPAEGAVS